MFKLGTKYNDHEMLITENLKDGFVEGLDFFCRTCHDGETFDKEDFVKYRLAMEAARNAAQEHAGTLDSLPWHLLD